MKEISLTGLAQNAHIGALIPLYTVPLKEQTYEAQKIKEKILSLYAEKNSDATSIKDKKKYAKIYQQELKSLFKKNEINNETLLDKNITEKYLNFIKDYLIETFLNKPYPLKINVITSTVKIHNLHVCFESIKKIYNLEEKDEWNPEINKNVHIFQKENLLVKFIPILEFNVTLSLNIPLWPENSSLYNIMVEIYRESLQHLIKNILTDINPSPSDIKYLLNRIKAGNNNKLKKKNDIEEYKKYIENHEFSKNAVFSDIALKKLYLAYITYLYLYVSSDTIIPNSLKKFIDTKLNEKKMKKRNILSKANLNT